MHEHTWRDRLLDGLLALLVLISVVLSVRIWYPPDEPTPALTGASVQPQPAAMERQMPEIFRPEMILFRQKGNQIAPVHTGSVAYRQIWPQIQSMLSGLRATGVAFSVDQVPERLLEGEWVQLRLPTDLMLSQWAEQWRWNAPNLRNGAIRVDRVTLYLGGPGAIYLSGPAGIEFYLADLSDDRRLQLLDLMAKLDPTLYMEHRPLQTKDLAARIAPGLLVPNLTAVHEAQVRVAPPDEQQEEARHFPDLSVVRQIDEPDARSLTDGPRLLRFTTSGLLQYRTADPSNPSAAPDLERAIALAQDWVGTRGGWPQEIVLRRYVGQPGKTRLEFDYRSGGPFPVESAEPAVQVHVTAQRVVYFSRYPSIVEVRFSPDQQPVITPEAAINRAANQFSLLLTEPIRSIHLAYVVKPAATGPRWELEPAWVLQAAEARIYVPAGLGQEKSPLQMNR